MKLRLDGLDNQDGSLTTEFCRLQIAETMMKAYIMFFRKVGNGMNVDITSVDGECISHNKNFNVMIRKLMLAEELIDMIDYNSIRYFWASDDNEKSKRQMWSEFQKYIDNFIANGGKLDKEVLKTICNNIE